MADPRRERKVVTALFADLVGFTARAEELDPEDVEAILRPYHKHLRSELERFGGTVEKFIGDAVMALFGAPVAHEDDPERAVRAALAIRDWARDDGEAEIRIAVNTGEALVSLGARPEAGEGMASGDVINTAARLQVGAPVNGVVVGETTQRATRHVIEYRELEPVSAKGKAEPVPVWEALEARSRFGADLLRVVRSPLVGRAHELALLRETLVRVREERSPQLVTLAGVPGIGKSRLVYELMQVVEHGGVLTYWRQGRSLPYGEAVTYWALGEMVKAQAGVLENDSAADVLQKLDVAVRNLVDDPAEAERLAAHLRPLAGAGAYAELSGDRRSEAFAAWRRFFEAMAEQRPLVLVFDDIHWADEGLLDFVDHLVDWAAGFPILVVCTARPELLERRPGWGGGKLNATTLSLSPLSDDETARLLATLLDQPVLDAATQQDLLGHAGGNPLYAEQYAEMYAERGEEGELPLPESVQGIIAARLDLLPPEEKAMLQNAAVLGKVFWLGAVADGRFRSAAEERLHALQRKGFVQRATRSSVADEEEYAFRHLLVREVAYGQIPRAERADKHRRAAEWIESLGRAEDHAETLAGHYRQALELARASGQPTGNLAERGRVALREAGDRAIALNAFAPAADFYASALELWPTDADDRPGLLLVYGTALAISRESGNAELAEAAEDLAALGDNEGAAKAEILLADAHWRANQRDRAYEHVERAVRLLENVPSSPAKARVLSEVSRYHMLADRSGEALQTGREALEMATELGLDEVRSHALNTIGTSRVDRGDPAGIGDLHMSIEIAREIGSPEILRGYNNLFAGFTTVGALDQAAQAVSAGLEAAERFPHAGATGRWLNFERVNVNFWKGCWDEALQIIEDTLAELGPAHALARWGYETRGRIRIARGDIDGGLEDARKSLDLGRKAKDPQTFFPALSYAAFASIAADRHSEAEAFADELLNLHAVGLRTGGLVSTVFDIAWVLDALGRGAELLEAAELVEAPTRWTEAAVAVASGDRLRAADIYAEMGQLPNEAYSRLRAADGFVAEGRRSEADVQLQQALAFYRSVGATRYVRDGEALLAATA